MKRRWGLRAKMAASYVLATAAAVAVVEAVLLGVVIPGLASGDSQGLVFTTAADYANQAEQAGSPGHLPSAAEFPIGDPAVHLRPGQGAVATDGRTVLIPYVSTAQSEPGPMSLALLIGTDNRIVASSYPARYRVGDAAMSQLPSGVADLSAPDVLKEKLKGTGHPGDTPSGQVIWSVALVLDDVSQSGAAAGAAKAPLTANIIGMVYVQVPASAKLPASGYAHDRWAAVLGQAGIGLLILIAAVPVGIVFGLLSTRRLLGRLRRLAVSTVAVADGDYHHQVPVSGRDEVAQLEDNFNRMAQRLAATMSAQRRLASAGERARIARELHDSISQDLFSLRMLAGGLRKALPGGSPLLAQVQTMEETVSQTMDEMQALLLELRPVALTDSGLAPALDELAGAYRDRLGLTVHTDLRPVQLGDAAEHAVLRIVQEALANAAKHARPDHVDLSLHQDDGRVRVVVRDDGQGMSSTEADSHHGLGLRLMRERVAELAGTIHIDSAPGAGTTIDITLPVDTAMTGEAP